MPQKKTVEMTKAEMDQAIKSTRPIDDELARVIFKDERAPELVQTILRTIPALKNVVVTKVNTQYDMPSLGFGKGVPPRHLRHRLKGEVLRHRAPAR